MAVARGMRRNPNVIPCSISIRSPLAPSRAFDHVCDQRNVSRWHHAIVSSELLGDDPMLRHARYRAVLRIARIRLTAELESVEIDRPRQLVFRSRTRFVHGDHELVFQTRGAGVEISTRSGYELLGPLRPLRRLVAPLLRRFTVGVCAGIERDLAELAGPGPTWIPGSGAVGPGPA